MIKKYTKSRIKSVLKKFKLNSVLHASEHFSQCGEDIYLGNKFKGKKGGFYVDVGAYHPFHLSNTYQLYCNGWRGINIEPNPTSYSKVRKGRPEDINLNLAVSDSVSEVLFNCDYVYSSIVEAGEDEGKNTISVKSEPLSSIFERHDVEDIDFISVDCEGFDIAVLETNDWDKWRPTVILIEDHEAKLDSEVDRYMDSIGYKLDAWMLLTKAYIAK